MLSIAFDGPGALAFPIPALLWAALYGWIFFAEPVSARTWAGAIIIGGACLWQARRAA